MPIINGHEYTPDAAIAADYCPECGADFLKVNARAHRLSHWRAKPPNSDDGDEARRRMALYDAYLHSHPQQAAATAPPKLRAGVKAPIELTEEAQP